MQQKTYRVLIAVLLTGGVLLIFYPQISNFIYSHFSGEIITQYAETTDAAGAEKCAASLEAARVYNQTITNNGFPLVLTPEQAAEYPTMLNLNGDGMMGYIEIPKINVSLPIYHGTADEVLQAGTGHIEGSSLPVGGENTHAIISGHSGLQKAKFFTDLGKLHAGDTFMLHVSGETLTYAVDQVQTVLPTEFEALRIEDGQDLCTLVTCTPVYVNSHRLLVRGHRVPNAPEAEAAPAEPETKHKALWFGLSGAALLALIVSVVLIKRNKRRARL